MALAALRLSLRYGCGDLHWFHRLPREDQSTMLALYAFDHPAPAARDGLDALKAAVNKRNRA